MEFEGRHAVVTGAGTGIGRAIALRLAAEGARVSLIGRREAPLAATSALAAAGPGGSLGVFPGDVCDVGSIASALGAAAAATGPIDIVVANAGVGGPNGPGFQPDGDPDRFGDLVQTNLAGTYHTFRAAIPLLSVPGGVPPSAAGAGPGAGAPHLVAVSSILARIGVAGYSGYCASKAGITGLVRAMAMELAPKAIQVNAVAPGWVDTEMAQEGIEGMAKGLGVTRDEAHALAMQDVPLGRMGRPEEIAGMVKWLVSADARGVTGQTLDMNGGAYMI